VTTDVQEILRYRDTEIAAIERNAEWTQDAKEAKNERLGSWLKESTKKQRRKSAIG